MKRLALYDTLKDHCFDNDIQMKELVNRLGVSKQFLHQIYHGEKNCPDELFNKLVEVVKIDREVLGLMLDRWPADWLRFARENPQFVVRLTHEALRSHGRKRRAPDLVRLFTWD